MVYKNSIITLLLCTVLILPAITLAEDKIRIAHRPLSVEHLPDPGIPVRLDVTLLNTTDLGFKLRTHIEVDGKNFSVPYQLATRDDYDRPSYRVPIFSPLVGMSYFFTAESSDGKVIRSKKYGFHRACIPPVSPVSDTTDTSIEAKANLETNIIRVQKLESEILQYEQAMLLIDELKHSLSEGGAQ